jgi:hypothetical protein
MSDTPRTDAATECIDVGATGVLQYVPIEFAEGLERENKELLEALNGLVWLAEPHFSDHTQFEHLKFCRAAIAKAEGK